MGVTRNADRYFIGKHEENKRFLRSRSRREDNIKVDLKDK
jgi:hypothetical protein